VHDDDDETDRQTDRINDKSVPKAAYIRLIASDAAKHIGLYLAN